MVQVAADILTAVDPEAVADCRGESPGMTVYEQFKRFHLAMERLPAPRRRLVRAALDRIAAGEPVADAEKWLEGRLAKGRGKDAS